MGLSKRHKSLFISNLRIYSGTFGTFGTIFRSFSALSLFFHILIQFFESQFVPICLFQSQFVPFSPFFNYISFKKTHYRFNSSLFKKFATFVNRPLINYHLFLNTKYKILSIIFIINPQFSVINSKYTILNTQYITIFNYQSSIINYIYTLIRENFTNNFTYA